MKTVKMIATVRYSVELLENTAGMYVIAYANLNVARTSEPIKDLNTALYLFQLKQDELEGQ